MHDFLVVMEIRYDLYHCLTTKKWEGKGVQNRSRHPSHQFSAMKPSKLPEPDIV